MSELRAALEAAIDDAPDDVARYAVLADWYQQHDDERGELIALQLATAKTPAQRAREAELLSRQRVGAAEIRWRWGFVEWLRFERTTQRDDWAGASLAPVLAHPACRFLRALELDAGPGDQALEWLSRHAPTHLRALTLTCNEAALGNVKGRLAKLETLRVAAQLLVPAVLPPLRELELPADAMTDAGLTHVLGTQPELRALTLTSLEAIDDDAMRAVAQLSRLEALTLRADLTTPGAVEVLVGSPLATSLITLDLSRSGLTEDAAKRLLDAVPGFARLSSLIVGER